MKSKSNWFVMTGGPSSGIDTTLNLLKKIGYPVINEIARGVIKRANRRGITAKELRKDEAKFQISLLPIKAALEKRLPREKIFFLNRGMPDSVAYLRNCGGDPRKAIKLCESNLYKRVFLLEQLPRFGKDYARTENSREAKKISRLISQAYEENGYEVIKIPVMSPEARVNLILSYLDKEDLIQ